MAALGKLLKTRRVGPAGLACNSANLAGEDSLALSSPDFENEGTIPTVHTAKRVGGKDLSPALAWSPVPEGTAQLLLVIEDPDAPTGSPCVHGVALLDPSLASLPNGALDAGNPVLGVRVCAPAWAAATWDPLPSWVTARTVTCSSSSPWPAQ